MLLHIGDNVVIPKKNVIAILEMETSASPITKEFLEIAADEGFVEKISEDKENTFIITTEKIFYSPISCNTLKKRAEKHFGHQ
jgi:hypothetical protein